MQLNRKYMEIYTKFCPKVGSVCGESHLDFAKMACIIGTIR